jgi:hypothetical protein
MKITIEKKEKIEIEIELPVYRKSSHHYYKIDENKSVCVYNGTEGSYSIEINEYMMKFPFDYEECTKEQFEEVYNKVKSKF